MPANYSLQLNNSNPILNNTIKLKLSNGASSVSSDLIVTSNFKIVKVPTNTLLTNNYSINSVSVGSNETTFEISFSENNFLASTPISIKFYLDSSNYSDMLNVFLLELNSITTNSASIIIPNRTGSNINSNNLIIKNLSTPSNTINYSLASSPLATSSSCTINFTNLSLSSIPVSIQFKEIDSNGNIIAISTILNISPLQLQLNSITNNSASIIIPNRIGANISSNNLIIKNLSSKSTFSFLSTGSLADNQYSISNTTSTSCTIIFATNFLENTNNQVSIQFKELDSNSNIIAISNLAYINFASPNNSKIELSKSYLVKYINKSYQVKITLDNTSDTTLPTNYKNTIYKATKK